MTIPESNEVTPKSPETKSSGDSLSGTDHKESEMVKAEDVYSPVVPLPPGSVSIGIGMAVNPTIIETLSQEAPKELLKFADASDQRQAQYFLKKEENRHQERLSRERTLRIGMASLLGVAMSAFLYAGLTKDSGLAQSVVSVVAGGLGGLGAGVVLSRRKDDE